MPTETISLEGHIIDSQLLARVLDEIVDSDASYEIVDLKLGVKHQDPSTARIEVTAASEGELARLLDRLQQHGANPERSEDATLVEADVEGAFPAGFYSSTNLETEVRIDGAWVRVEHPEMDCGIVVEGRAARTMPMGEVTKGARVVMAGLGIRVLPLPRTVEG